MKKEYTAPSLTIVEITADADILLLSDVEISVADLYGEQLN